MIQIDDSGWGSLLGGVMVGVYNTETQKMYAKLIPVTFFQGGKFEDKRYLEKASSIAYTGIHLLTDYPDSGGITVQICRGYCLAGVRQALKRDSNIMEVEEVKITDPFQSLLETKFSKYLGRYGIPNKSGSGAHRISFNDMLEWVREKPERVKHVKTGWKAWTDKYSKMLG
jgi:hypothetical protein